MNEIDRTNVAEMERYIKQLEDENLRLKNSNKSLRTNNEGLLKGTNKLQKELTRMKKERNEDRHGDSETLYFERPSCRDITIASAFGLKCLFKDKHSSIYDNSNVRFCFNRKSVIVILYQPNDELKKKIKDYFYEKQWKNMKKWKEIIDKKKGKDAL